MLRRGWILVRAVSMLVGELLACTCDKSRREVVLLFFRRGALVMLLRWLRL